VARVYGLHRERWEPFGAGRGDASARGAGTSRPRDLDYHLASLLFREGAPNRFRINLSVIGAYLTVVVLHGLWDGLPRVIAELTGSGIDVIIGQGLVGLTGLLILCAR
jgi:hypothetical protein